MAYRKPRVASPDDGGGYVFDDSSPLSGVVMTLGLPYFLLTSTVTFVGLVTQSYTAERF